MCAKTKAIRQRIAAMMTAGSDKQSTYNALKGQGVSDTKLAMLVAGYTTPETRAAYTWRIRGLIAMMVIQTFLVSLLGLSMGVKSGGAAIWYMPLLLTSIPLILLYGFIRHRLWAYNAYFLLSITGLPNQLKGVADDPQGTLIGMAVSFVMLAYVLYVRYCLFPEVTFVSAAKRNGDFVFPARNEAS